MAQIRAESTANELIYVATGQAGDAEMARRIRQHRAERGERWRTIEAPLDLPQTLIQNDAVRRTLLVDCLTLWLSNLMLAEYDIRKARRSLVDALAASNSTVLLVSNEVGMGIVPDNTLARRFRDEAGWLHQKIAAVADEVWLVMAGLLLPLKNERSMIES
nr:bifunctional adenosylcobinamide kinase/adenosylcobinamide-phosphate guanylyltransferase [Steroidobacter denitrificans]